VLNALVARGGDKREEGVGVARRDRGKPIAWHTGLKAQRWRGEGWARRAEGRSRGVRWGKRVHGPWWWLAAVGLVVLGSA
jgi:hypothetical protein